MFEEGGREQIVLVHVKKREGDKSKLKMVKTVF